MHVFTLNSFPLSLPDPTDRLTERALGTRMIEIIKLSFSDYSYPDHTHSPIRRLRKWSRCGSTYKQRRKYLFGNECTGIPREWIENLLVSFGFPRKALAVLQCAEKVRTSKYGLLQWESREQQFSLCIAPAVTLRPYRRYHSNIYIQPCPQGIFTVKSPWKRGCHAYMWRSLLGEVRLESGKKESSFPFSLHSSLPTPTTNAWLHRL